MNITRGYRRLSLAILGLWVIGWAVIGGVAARRQAQWLDILARAEFADESQMILVSQRVNDNADLVEMALFCEILVVPIALAFAIIWWVIRASQSNGNS